MNKTERQFRSKEEVEFSIFYIWKEKFETVIPFPVSRDITVELLISL